MELYTAPFRLRPGTWQLTAIAKKQNFAQSGAAQSGDIECRMEEDKASVFCEAKGPNPTSEVLSLQDNKVSMATVTLWCWRRRMEIRVR